MPDEIVAADQQLTDSAALMEIVGVNRIFMRAELEEAHGPMIAIVLEGRFAKLAFAGHPSPDLQTMWLANRDGLVQLLGRVRVACEMNGINWTEVIDDSDRLAAGLRAEWDPRLGGTGIPAEHMPPPGLGDLGSTQD